MELEADHRSRAMAVGTLCAAAWLALIVTAVIVLGPVVGLLLGLWGVSLMIAGLIAVAHGVRAALGRGRRSEHDPVPAPA